MARVLIKNCLLVPMVTPPGGEGELCYEGEVAVEGERIVAVGPPGAAGDFRPDVVLDGTGLACLPGLVNAHTHAAMTLFRGYADDLPLQPWLEEKIWPIEARLTPDDIYWGSLLACVEMLEGGCTTFADMYFAMDRVAQAVQESGMRAVLARGLIGVQPNGEAALREGQGFARDFRAAAGGRITAMLGPHAPYTCPPDYLRRVADAAAELGVGLHIHVAETSGEFQDIYRQYGKTPVQLLDEAGVFSVPALAAHCVHLTEEDIHILAERRVGVAHNPQSNMKLASGIAPVSHLLQAGLSVGVGTDGASSNNDLDMWEELRTASLLAKVHDADPTAVPAYQALYMATCLGARAVGLGDRVGVLAPGYQADLILVNLDRPHFHPRHDLLAHLAYAAHAADVETVLVAGKIVVEKGRVTTVDRERVFREAGQRARRLAEG